MIVLWSDSSAVSNLILGKENKPLEVIWPNSLIFKIVIQEEIISFDFQIVDAHSHRCLTHCLLT